MSNVLKTLSRGGAAVAETDPNFKQTTLLLKGDGNQGANNLYNPGPPRYLAFTDNSNNNFPIVVNGDAYGDNFSPFSSADGNWSAYFGGSGNYIRPPSNAAFSMGTGNFTIEAWINIFTYTNSGMLFDFRVNSGFQALAFYLQSTGRLTCWTGSNEVGNTGSSVTINTWNHIAFVRNSGTIKAYLNGVEQWSLSIGNDISNNTLTVASSFDGTGIFTGYMSNVRLVKGTAVYTSNFTPSTTPLTAISGTSLLTCQSNRFVDKSSNNFAITTFGTVTQTKPVNPFSTTFDTTSGSGYFDGNGDYLTIPDAAAFDFGTGDMTMEAWFYLTGNASTNIDGNRVASIYSSLNNGVTTNGFFLYIDGNGSTTGTAIGLLRQSTTSPTSGTVRATYTFDKNTWYHVAYVRSGGTNYMYVNGTSVTLTTNTIGSSDPLNGDFTVHIGDNANVDYRSYFPGYISNFRAVKGTAVTPPSGGPSGPVTAISGTSLLALQYQGSVRNVGFIDSSPYDNVINRTGNTTQGTFSPFSGPNGYWGNYFGGEGNYLSVPANTAFNFGTGDFTMECFVWATDAGRSADATKYGTIFSGAANLSTLDVWSGGIIISGGVISTVFFDANNVNLLTASGQNISINAWHHFVFCRTGTTLSIFVDGTRIATTTSSASINTNSSGTVQIARNAYGSLYVNWLLGYFANARIIKGSGPYNATQTTLTVPTIPLTNITNTSLLTCQSNRFVDNSTNAFTVTAVGSPRVTPFSPFAPTAAYSPSVNGGSAYFDGTGDSLSVVANTAVSTGSDNFTLEAWVWPNAIPTNILFDFRNTAYGSPAFYTNNTGQLRVWDGNGEIGGTGTAVSLGAWNHIAFVRSGNTLFAYLNGVQQWSSAFSPNMNTNSLRIGAQFDSTGGFSGYMSGIRLTKGQALYTTTFTTPTAPPTSTVNTGLLLNFTNAGILDQTGKNVLETVGNAQIDTSVKKYGTGSMKFDGTGDYLLIPSSPDMQMGSGDFTWECWIYMNSLAANFQGIVDTGTSGARSTGGLLYFGTSTLSYYSNNAVIVSSASFPTNTWKHIAVTRSGSTVRLFVDGTQAGSSGTSSTNMTSPVIYIGNTFDNYALNGLIDDFRITKGVARYTSNFTPPIKELPNQ